MEMLYHLVVMVVVQLKKKKKVAYQDPRAGDPSAGWRQEGLLPSLSLAEGNLCS